MELAEPSVRSEASAHLKKMFQESFSENAAMVVQLEPLPACLVHLVSLTTSLGCLHSKDARFSSRARCMSSNIYFRELHVSTSTKPRSESGTWCSGKNR